MLSDPGSQSTVAGPLSEIKVLDLSSYVAGPYACSLLADLGAEVIKIESPGGDSLRQYPSSPGAESPAFLGTNRSKRGIALDLKREQELAVLMRLVESADALVHNCRPSVPARLGIGYERLKAVNPRLIYCALTGYGETGPMSNKAGYDQVLQCFTGICTFQGSAQKAGGKPEIVLGSVGDFYAASLFAYGITAAIFHRERTGEGQYVGLSLLGAALAMQSGCFICAEGEDSSTSPDLRSGGITGIHPTGHGELYVSANTAHFWRSLCTLVGLPELSGNPKYDTVRKRAKCAAEIIPAIREALKAHTALESEEIFGEEVPCCAIRPIEEMFGRPQVLAQGLVTTVEHPRIGTYQGLRKPLKFSETPGPEPFAAPTLGQHADEILASAGYSEKRYRETAKAGSYSTLTYRFSGTSTV